MTWIESALMGLGAIVAALAGVSLVLLFAHLIMVKWAQVTFAAATITEAMGRARWYRWRCERPPAAYLGGKRAYARHIVQLMGGWERPSSVVLCDAGPWGEWWRTVLVDGLGALVAEAVADLDRRAGKAADLHRALAVEGVRDPVRRAAAFVALQASAMRGKPVARDGDAWRTPGYAHLSDTARRKGFPETLRPLVIAERVLDVAGIDWPPVTVIQGDAGGVRALGGRVVIDPPYRDTTGYGAELSRARVTALARRHAASGAVVGICEGEPIAMGDGWRPAEVERDGWQKRLAPVCEWLTVNKMEAAREDRGAMMLRL